MTDEITWGEPIATNGKCPEWLRDDDAWQWGPNAYVEWVTPLSPASFYPAGAWGDAFKHIRLPADHPYYLATSRGFEYRPSGDDEQTTTQDPELQELRSFKARAIAKYPDLAPETPETICEKIAARFLNNDCSSLDLALEAFTAGRTYERKHGGK